MDKPIFVAHGGLMKTTIEIPDRLFRAVKVSAASRGESLRQFFTDAVVERLRYVEGQSRRPWMKHYGALRNYSDELDRIERIVENEFESVHHGGIPRAVRRLRSARNPKLVSESGRS